MINVQAIVPLRPGVEVYTSQPAPPMDVLMVSGFLLGILTLLFWMHLGQTKSVSLAFGTCLGAMGVFALLEGAWPAGLVMIALSAKELYRFWPGRKLYPYIIDKLDRQSAFPVKDEKAEYHKTSFYEFN